MVMPIKRVGIISKPKKSEVREIVPGLLEWLRESKRTQQLCGVCH